MAQLTLHVLGAPRIQVDGAAVHIARRRALACAVYLAVTGRAQSRDTLATLFWPEEDQHHARADLRRTLYLLHQTFGPDRLRVDHDVVQVIHDNNLWLDVAHFRRLLATCTSHGHAPDEVCSACLPPLAAAVALYRDDFLAGFTLPDSPDFDQWQFDQGEQLRGELAAALERLVRGYVIQGEFAQAIAYSRRWLALDPLHEPAQGWLMQLYAWSNQQSAALRQYREYAQLLAAELGSEPTAETQKLQRAIKAHRLAPPAAERLRVVAAPLDGVALPAPMPPVEDELRLTTILSVGLHQLATGDADQAEDLDHLAAQAEQLFTLTTNACAPYGGQVERAPGGDLLAIFGLETMHEDDPERALRAALSIQQATAAEALAVQMGVNTGLIYCAHPSAADTPTVLGAAVNLAVQLRSRAAVGQIVASKALYRATRGVFDVASLSLPLPGVTAPVTAYHILRLRSHPEKVRGVEGHPVALVGRDEELARLTAAFDQVMKGAGHLVLISGPAGVGKSRLVAELKHQVTPIPHSASRGRPRTPHWLDGRCLAFATTTSYWLFIDALRHFLGEAANDDEQALAQRLVALLQTLAARGDLTAAQVEEIGPLLGHLLALRFGSDWDERLSRVEPAQMRSRMLNAVQTFIIALARGQPVVLICEDLHWADALSLDLLARLIKEIGQTRLLLVCVYRPEQAQAGEPLVALANQQDAAHCTQITLTELTASQSGQLLAALLAGEMLPAPTRDLILTTAQGNPFFLEEIVRALLDQGLPAVVGEVTTPETVQQVILSRVEHLPPIQKRLLQGAAVIGRLFRPRLLAATAPAELDLDRALAALTDEALIYEERTIPEREYSFRHVLVQDAVYHALPGRRRAKLHQQVAEGLERLYAGELEAYIEQLAYHYDRSGAKAMPKAVEFLARAGEKARRAYLNDAAIAYFERALARQAELPANAAGQTWRLLAVTGLGHVYLTTTRFNEAERYFRQAIALAEALHVAPREQARLYGWLCRVLRSQSRIDEVVRACEAGLACLGDDQTAPEAANLYGNIADVYNVKGDRRKFREIMAQIVPFLPQAPCTGDTLMVYGHAVTLCLARKQIDEALRWLNLIEQGLQAGHELMPLAWMHMWVAAWIWEAIGDFKRSFTHYTIAIELCRQTGSDYELAWALGTVALHHYVSGDLTNAEAVIQQSYAYKEQVGAPGELMEDEDLMARLAYCRGELAVATAILEKTLERVQHSGFAFAYSSQKTLLGRLYLIQEEPAKALAQFQSVIGEAIADPQGMPWIVGALAGVEVALHDENAFQTYCRQVQAQRPELTLPQWWLEPAEVDLRFLILDFGFADAPNHKSRIVKRKWVDPLGDCAWTAEGNAIVINAANHRDLWVNNLSAPRLLDAVTGDFAVEMVCCAAAPDRPAIGGLLLWQNQENYLRLTWGEYGPHQVVLAGCLANADQILARGRLAHAGQVILRLERKGSQVRALCSADGQVWFSVGQVNFPVDDPVEVGLHAIGKLERVFYPGAYPHGTAIRFTTFQR
ncbi:MAG: AAA family ATPase [Caldilineaceae bacterium]